MSEHDNDQINERKQVYMMAQRIMVINELLAQFDPELLTKYMATAKVLNEHAEQPIGPAETELDEAAKLRQAHGAAQVKHLQLILELITNMRTIQNTMPQTPGPRLYTPGGRPN